MKESVIKLPHTDTIPESSICVQCGKCSSGCPVAFESAHTPRKIIRFLQWGCLKEASQSPFLWLCASCQACTVRCPRGVNISSIMLSLRRIAQQQGWVLPEEKLSYYKTFINMIKKRGKISELQLGLATALHKIPSHPIEDIVLFFKLLKRGKLR
ncbi:MAG: 4Fe-4S dicluster domain-containing protein [Nitrospirae bacterium]|nr:4Fe-4S dicluster domain-containing protein [Nitrospirota bacterium]